MIKCLKKNNLIEISGHANFKDYGEDIVCASVSSIIFTIVNCCLNIDSNSIRYEDDGEKIIIEKLNENTNIDILLNTMIELLKDLASKYKENIKVESEE